MGWALVRDSHRNPVSGGGLPEIEKVTETFPTLAERSERVSGGQATRRRRGGKDMYVGGGVIALILIILLLLWLF